MIACNLDFAIGSVGLSVSLSPVSSNPQNRGRILMKHRDKEQTS